LLDRDARMLEHAAHCLRGQLGYLGLSEVSEAQKLEDAGRTGELSGVEDLLAGLQIRLAEVWSILSKNPLSQRSQTQIPESTSSSNPDRSAKRSS
jgi:HPt (histidine-containing phosphotransfer) domain-containing protein